MTTEHSTYTYETGEQETVALTRGPGTPHGHALLRIKHDDGKTLDCYVNTAWLRDRLNDLGEPCREGAEDMNSHTACEDTLSLVQQQRDQAIGRVNALSDENDNLRARAEKAERERDEARANAYNWEATAEEWEKRALAESRPLTPDAITVEMCRRAYRAFEKSASWEDALIAALTEPPKRPEGAEDIEALIREHVKANPGTDDASIADWLAERGVRVTGGN